MTLHFWYFHGMNRIKILLCLMVLFVQQLCLAQTGPTNGIKTSQASSVVLINATIQLDSKTIITNASMWIEDGVIREVGKKVNIPKGVYVHDCSDQYIVASFIDLNSNLGVDPKTSFSTSDITEYPQNRTGQYEWNDAVHPEYSAAPHYHLDETALKHYRSMGFGTVLTHANNGIFQGNGALVLLTAGNNNPILRSEAAQFMSFNKGESRQAYPTSQAGAIALIRQTLYDLERYIFHAKQANLSLDALKASADLPVFFHTNDFLEIGRVAKIGREFKKPVHILGTGSEYLALNELKQNNLAVTIPLNFPKPFETKDPFLLDQVNLRDLKHWELAPSNPYFLAAKDIPFSMSAQGVLDTKTFWNHVHTSIERGLPIEKAIAALTENPAAFIGQSKQLGSLSKGKIANFAVYSANPFAYDAILLENWVAGEKFQVNAISLTDISGLYNLNISGKIYPFELKANGESWKARIQIQKQSSTKKDTLWHDMAVELADQDLAMQTTFQDDNFNGTFVFTGKCYSKLGVLEGNVRIPSGELISWSAIKNAKVDASKVPQPYALRDSSYSKYIWKPDMAFGSIALPHEGSFVIKNATIWTNEKQGIIEHGSVWIRDGKIAYVGKDTTHTHHATVIDLDGKVLTSGIIDEHSHIALSRGVNESGQAISAEVSMSDVIDPYDINIYRQLAGGVTAAQLLHGSANPIGGQSALIKLKWGSSADEMLIPNAPKFIKFALGENVKQSNWGDNNTVRFPQTRMGVEQVYFDAFSRARDYAKEWKDHHQKLTSKHHNYKHLPRRDLELDALAEILNGTRNITCHSYVQSEVNMLLHVADSFGFKVNTFTHILEGYKLADKLAEHGAGGSTFSDWWAYKYEVRDAIPYNAQLMADRGVIVSINSDDAEMGRRLNQEAAKAIKYGGMKPEDAWKLVTLNPAKLLHLDNRMGSIKKGKDADLVIWSMNPLSMYAQAEMTFVDGVLLYDKNQQASIQKRMDEERARILTAMQKAQNSGQGAQPVIVRKKGTYHCNTIGMDKNSSGNEH